MYQAARDVLQLKFIDDFFCHCPMELKPYFKNCQFKSIFLKIIKSLYSHCSGSRYQASINTIQAVDLK